MGNPSTEQMGSLNTVQANDKVAAGFHSGLVCRYNPEKLPESFEASYAGEYALPSSIIVMLMKWEIMLVIAKMHILWSVREATRKNLDIAEIEEKQVTLLSNPGCPSCTKLAEQCTTMKASLRLVHASPEIGGVLLGKTSCSSIRINSMMYSQRHETPQQMDSSLEHGNSGTSNLDSAQLDKR